MATDGALTVTIPVSTNTVTGDIDEIKENFEYLRRIVMNICIPPINGATITYGYTSGKLTSLTYGGTLAGSATFTYTGDNLTTEAWTLYGKTITYTHTYTGSDLTGSSVVVA